MLWPTKCCFATFKHEKMKNPVNDMSLCRSPNSESDTLCKET